MNTDSGWTSGSVGVQYLEHTVPKVQPGTQKEDGQVGRWEYSILSTARNTDRGWKSGQVEVQYLESTITRVQSGIQTEDCMWEYSTLRV